MRNVLMTMAAAVLAMTGCESGTPEHLDATKMYPDMKTGNAESTGTLYVDRVAATRAQDQGEGRNAPLPPVLYSVYDGKGNLVTTSRISDVELPAGRYLVRLENEDKEFSPFWVTIEKGKRTVVNAERFEADYGGMEVK